MTQDFRVSDLGDTFTFEPMTDAARVYAAWLDMGDCYRIDAESAEGVIGSIEANGFTISRWVYTEITYAT